MEELDVDDVSLFLLLEPLNRAVSSSALILPSLLVSNAEKIFEMSDELLVLSDELEDESLGGGGGIPPGGGGGILPSFPCGGFIFLSAAISSSVLKLPSLFVSSLLKASAVDELLLVLVELLLLLELDARACAAVLNSAESIEPLLLVSIELSNSLAKSSKLGLSVCFDEDVPEEL